MDIIASIIVVVLFTLYTLHTYIYMLMYIIISYAPHIGVFLPGVVGTVVVSLLY